mmetsp:Transcript_3774/g.6281  ORF Transcript_3774/g.6281 Transcript_3774/m.6281 type:complete len:266 (-) Transcript_3774:308-1105(-)
MTVDKEMHVAPQRGHHFKVGLTFAYIARKYLAANENVLLLEVDYLEMSNELALHMSSDWRNGFGYGPGFWRYGRDSSQPLHIDKASLGTQADDVRLVQKFLKSELWHVLRLGYDLYMENVMNRPIAYWLDERNRCRSECRCTISRSVPWICSVQKRGGWDRGCQIGSTVAIAFHQRMLQALSSYGYGVQFGLIKDPKSTPETNIDNWITNTISPVHFVAPARIVQNQVHKITHHSGTKSANVQLNHTPETSFANMLSFASNCITD